MQQKYLKNKIASIKGSKDILRTKQRPSNVADISYEQQE